MNIQYNNYSLFIPSNINTLLSQKIQKEKNLLLTKSIGKFEKVDIKQLTKFLNIWLNIKYFNCKYNSNLEKQCSFYFYNK
mgnify:CR=1 FL=1